MSTAVNYRANIYALKAAGCTMILVTRTIHSQFAHHCSHYWLEVTTACGSLREELVPGHLVMIDQYIDRTTKRPSTFYDASVADVRGVMHLPQGDPFSGTLRQLLLETCQELGYGDRVHSKGTMISIEGPR